MPHRLTILAAGCAAGAALVMTGCSASARHAPRRSSPAAATRPVPPTAAPASPASATSGALAVAVTGLPARPALRLGGPALAFTVVVRNSTASTYADITAVVSLAHCTCNPSPVPMAPDGTMQERTPGTGAWRSVFYDLEGGGTDFLNSTGQPGFTLRPDATASFTFRIALFPRQRQPFIHDGQTAIDVTIEALPARTVIGSQKAATAPVTVLTH